jgi:hypothetical protein
MRSAALDLTWYQYFLLDVIAMLALAVGLALLGVFLILRSMLRNVFSGRRQDTDKVLRKKKRS